MRGAGPHGRGPTVSTAASGWLHLSDPSLLMTDGTDGAAGLRQGPGKVRLRARASALCRESELAPRRKWCGGGGEHFLCPEDITVHQIVS